MRVSIDELDVAQDETGAAPPAPVASSAPKTIRVKAEELEPVAAPGTMRVKADELELADEPVGPTRMISPAGAEQFDEPAFQKWYADYATKLQLSPDPDEALHSYDYRAAYKAGAFPDATGHWPSQFKKIGHLNEVVGGFSTITSERVPGTPRADEAELVRMGWTAESAKKLASIPEPRAPITGPTQRGGSWGPQPTETPSSAAAPSQPAKKPNIFDVIRAVKDTGVLPPGLAAAYGIAEKIPVVKEMAEGAVAGAANTIESALAIGHAAGVVPDAWLKGAQEVSKTVSPEVSQRRIAEDPAGTIGNWKWWATTAVGEQLPFMASLAASGIVTQSAKGAAALAAAGESLLEGGSTYSEAIEHGLSKPKAQMAAAFVAIMNLPALWATNLPIFQGLTKSKLRNIAIAMASEAAQEDYQQLLSNVTAKATYDPERNLLDGLVESTVISSVMGGSMHAVSGKQAEPAAAPQVEGATAPEAAPPAQPAEPAPTAPAAPTEPTAPAAPPAAEPVLKEEESAPPVDEVARAKEMSDDDVEAEMAKIEADEEGLTDEEVETKIQHDITAEEGLPVRETPTPESIPVKAAADVQSGQYARVDPKQILADPARFQFKSDANEAGVTQEAKIEGPWNPNRGGLLLVWKDPANGQLYVVNGHHRLDAAKRMNAPDVAVKVLDDMTADEARVEGALTNIAEDKGTPIDAAKVFRAQGPSQMGLREVGINPRSRLAREGVALAKLSDPLFQRVAMGDLDEGHGVAIGEGELSPEQQMSVVKLIERQARDMTLGQVRALVRTVKNSADVKADPTQPDIFGNETLENTAVEEAVLTDWLTTKLGQDKRLFGFVAQADRARRLAEGGNVINREESGARASEAARVLDVFKKLVDKVGPISKAVKAGAARIVQGENANVVRKELYAAIGDAVAVELGGAKPKADDTVRAPDAGRDAAGGEVHPSADRGGRREAESEPKPKDVTVKDEPTTPEPKVTRGKETFKPETEAARKRSKLYGDLKGPADKLAQAEEDRGLDPETLKKFKAIVDAFAEDGITGLDKVAQTFTEEFGENADAYKPYLTAAVTLRAVPSAPAAPKEEARVVVTPVTMPDKPVWYEKTGDEPVGFGKHARMLVKDLAAKEPDYAQWLYGNATSGRAKRVREYLDHDPAFQKAKATAETAKDLTPEAALTDDTIALLKHFDMTAAPAPNGYIFIGGNTYENKDTIKKAGGRFDGATQTWQIRPASLGQITDDLKGRRDAGERRGIPRATYKSDAQLGSVRARADAEPDSRRLEQPVGAYVSARTQELIRAGEKIGIPADVVAEQIEDIALIARAFETNRPLFVLASEPGSGKTYVLGGAMREVYRRRPDARITYVTLRQELISQIREDLAAFGIDKVNIITYPAMREMDVEDTDVLIFDEAHSVKNITGAAQAKVAAEWIERSGLPIFATATPFENPVQMAYLSSAGIFNDYGDFANWAQAYGASTFKLQTGNVLLRWKRTTSSDEDGKAAREWLVKKGVYTSRKIRLPEDQVDSRLVKIDAPEADATRYREFAGAVEKSKGALQANAMMWVVNFQKRLLEASKIEQGIAEAQSALDRGRFPIVFVETKAERIIDIPDLIRREQEWQMAMAQAAAMHERGPARKDYGLPPAGITEVMSDYMHMSGEDKITIPSAEEMVINHFGKDQVAVFTGSVTPKKAQENLTAWRKGTKPVIVATMAKGGTGLSLHDKIGDHQTTQININMPWSATGVIQVAQRSARYGLKGRAEIQWIFADNIPFDRKLAGRVGGRMADMGAVVHGERPKDSAPIENWDFEDDLFSDAPEAPPSKLSQDEQDEDILSTGEVQKRLPGDVGAVREQEVAAPAIAREQDLTTGYTKPALKTVFGLTDAEAGAVDAIVKATGLDESRIRLGTGQQQDRLDTYFQHAGPQAQLSDHMRSALGNAQAMAAAGKTSEEIRAVTGWYPSPYDGKLRWELPDDGVALTQAFTDLPETPLFPQPDEVRSIPLREAIRHPALFEAYPDLGDIKVTKKVALFDRLRMIGGQFDAASGVLNITPYAHDPIASLVHELQHAIQYAEGFSGGASSAGVVARTSDADLAKAAARELANVTGVIQRTEVLRDQNVALAEALTEIAEAATRKVEAEFRHQREQVRGSLRGWTAVDFEAGQSFKTAMEPYVKSTGLTQQQLQDAFHLGSLEKYAAYVKDEIKTIKKDLKALEAVAAGFESDDRSDVEAAVRKVGGSRDLYRRVPGEIEAFDTQARAAMTPEQRATTAPYASQNVAPEDAVHLTNALEKAPTLQQGEKASVTFAEDGQAIIRAGASADVSSAIHEIAHVIRRQLMNRDVSPAERAGITDEDIRTTETWAGAKDGLWDRPAEEKFARGFERYLQSGEAPTESLKSVFAKFAAWLTAIYRQVAGSQIDYVISPEMKRVFDRIVTRQARVSADAYNTPVQVTRAAWSVPAPTAAPKRGKLQPRLDFDKDQGSLFQDGPNILYSPSRAMWDGYTEEGRLRPYRIGEGLKKALDATEDNAVSPAGLRAEIEAAVAHLGRRTEQARAQRMRLRVRGADAVRERLIKARRTGDLSHELVDFALWLIDKNEAIADDVWVSVRAQGKGMSGASGAYNPAGRMIALFKGHDNEDTAVHELMHHAERMMPTDLQEAIRDEWSKRLGDAWDAAEGNTERRRLLDAMAQGASGSAVHLDTIKAAFAVGTLSYEDYALVNPSEFFAVNAARILSGRYKAEGSWVAEAKQWLKEFAQKARGWFGLSSDAQILKGLARVLAGNGEFLSRVLLADSQNLFLAMEKDDKTPTPKRQVISLVRAYNAHGLTLWAAKEQFHKDFGVGSYKQQKTFELAWQALTGEKPPSRAGNINLDKFPLAPDVKRELALMIEENNQYLEQRRFVRSWEETRAAAVAIPSPHKAPAAGTAFNAEELDSLAGHLVAVREQLSDVSGQIAESRRNGKAPDIRLLTTEASLLSRTHVLLATLAGATAEAGRALNILRKIRAAIKSDDETLMDAVIEILGGREDLEHIAKGLQQFAPDDHAGRYRYIRSYLQVHAADWASWWWYTSLLSGPLTHARNALGNTSSLVYRFASMPGASAMDFARAAVTGTPRTTHMSEFGMALVGAQFGMREGVRKALYMLEHGFTLEDATNIEVRPPEIPGGIYTNFIGRALEAADIVFRSTNAMSYLYGLAHAAAKRKGLAMGSDEAHAFMADYLANPPKGAMEAMQREGARSVFRQAPGHMLKGFNALKTDWTIRLESGRKVKIFNPMKLFVPFVQTPGNIMKASFEVTPFGFVSAPFKETPREKAEAAGRALTGTMLLVPLWFLVAQGLVSGSGPDDKELRDLLYREGWQPNSIKIGDSWYNYSNFQPLALPLSVLANAYESWTYAGHAPSIAEVASKTAQSVLQQSYLSGLSALLDAVDASGAWGKANAVANKTVNSLLGFASLRGQIARAIDPEIRQPETMGEYIQANTPGFTGGIRPRRDVFGEVSERGGTAATRLLSPVGVTREKPAAINDALMDIRNTYQLGFPARQITIPSATRGRKGREVALTPDEYDALLADSGQAIKRRVEQRIAQPTWANLTEERQAEVVSEVVTQERARAKARILPKVRARLAEVPAQ